MTATLRRLIRMVPGFEMAKGFVRDRLLADLMRRRRFADIYATNYWRNGESRSGLGSSLEQTEAVRAALPVLCGEFGITNAQRQAFCFYRRKMRPAHHAGDVMPRQRKAHRKMAADGACAEDANPHEGEVLFKSAETWMVLTWPRLEGCRV